MSLQRSPPQKSRSQTANIPNNPAPRSTQTSQSHTTLPPFSIRATVLGKKLSSLGRPRRMVRFGRMSRISRLADALLLPQSSRHQAGGPARLGLWTALGRQGKVGGAEAAYREAVRLDPGDAHSRVQAQRRGSGPTAKRRWDRRRFSTEMSTRRASFSRGLPATEGDDPREACPRQAGNACGMLIGGDVR